MAAHESIPKEIGPGKKLFFYESKGSKSILGESEIQKLKLLNYSQVLSQKIENMVQTSEELRDYVGGRIEKKMLVFFLRKIIFYEKSYPLGKGITMTGQYVSEEKHNLIKTKIKR